MGMTPYTSMTNQQTRDEVEKGKRLTPAPPTKLGAINIVEEKQEHASVFTFSHLF